MDPGKARALNFKAQLTHPEVSASKEHLSRTQERIRTLLDYPDVEFLEGEVMYLKNYGSSEQMRVSFSASSFGVELVNSDTVHLSHFAKQVVEVARIAFEDVGVPVIFEQKYSISKLFSDDRIEDSRVFLAEKACSLEPKILSDAFSRPILLFGIRFHFPPRLKEEDFSEFDVKIESFMRDAKQFFILNKARFLPPPPLMLSSVGEIEDNIKRTDDFINEAVFEFLTHYGEDKK